MNLQRFDRFSQSSYLQRIGRERLTSLLEPHAEELLSLGFALSASRQPDALFYRFLTSLPQCQEMLSEALRDTLTAIEVIEEVFPDERTSDPVVVSEIRLRLSDRARPVLLTAGGSTTGDCPSGGVDGEQMGDGRSNMASCMVVTVGADGSGVALAPYRTDGTKGTEAGTACEDARPTNAAAQQHRPTEPRTSQREFPTEGKARYKFSRKGSVYVVRYDGWDKFHIAVTDGTKYVDVLLHDPNTAWRAFDLERRVKPDKAVAREANSAQPVLDGKALRALRANLRELEEDLVEAEAQGAVETAMRVEEEIGAIKKSLLNNPWLGGDSGERARNNVRKAIGKVFAKLRKGGPGEQAFGRHLEECISLGYELVYTQAAGRVWGDSVTCQ